MLIKGTEFHHHLDFNQRKHIGLNFVLCFVLFWQLGSVRAHLGFCIEWITTFVDASLNSIQHCAVDSQLLCGNVLCGKTFPAEAHKILTTYIFQNMNHSELIRLPCSSSSNFFDPPQAA